MITMLDHPNKKPLLTGLELSVMKLLMDRSIGNNFCADIAERLILSPRTVHTVVQSIYNKLCLYESQRHRFNAIMTYAAIDPEGKRQLEESMVVAPANLPDREQRRAALRPQR